VTATPTITLTPSVTGTPTQTRTPTATRRPGADITYVGLARASDDVLAPSGTTPEGWPIYERPFGYAFTLVVEAKPGPSTRTVGPNAFSSNPADPSVRPDLQVIVSRALGDGSPAICDDMPPFIGGVPASPSFDLTQPISDAINDLGCRFLDGSGQPRARDKDNACTKFADGNYKFVSSNATVQFCSQVGEAFEFPVGDTVVTVRVRDVSGQPGPQASFVVRVLP
jgi:hypothetical protein